MIESGAKPENILIVSGSVESDEVLKNLVEETVKKFGKLDVLVRFLKNSKLYFFKD